MNEATTQLVEILSRNKKTVMIALIAAILVAIVILAVQAFSRKNSDEE